MPVGHLLLRGPYPPCESGRGVWEWPCLLLLLEEAAAYVWVVDSRWAAQAWLPLQEWAQQGPLLVQQGELEVVLTQKQGCNGAESSRSTGSSLERAKRL